MRDDFPIPVVETLAKRVGNRCSNPACRKRISGPHADDDKALNVGVAAHVTAAFVGGPRHDPSIGLADRKGIGNSIWLCQSCAKLVDNDEAKDPAGKPLKVLSPAMQKVFGSFAGHAAIQRSPPRLVVPGFV